MTPTHRTKQVKAGTYRQFSYKDLKPNPLNPRRLFDQARLEVLQESIRANGILVPLTVYKEERTGQHYIIDGERRWRCAQAIEDDAESPRRVKIPANIVAPPTSVANILWMFNIHNLREQWDLMPTALSLKFLMEKLKETNDQKLSKLTQLSLPNVTRCKKLLSYPQKYQKMMLDVDPTRRVKANFFIELHPVLDLYMSLSEADRGGKTRSQLIDHLLLLYRKRKIPSVIHFRRILEAHDYIEDEGRIDKDKETKFLDAARELACSQDRTIRQLFDPLTTEDKSIDDAEKLCKDFVSRMRKLKVEHVFTRRELRKALQSVKKYVDDLLTKLEG